MSKRILSIYVHRGKALSCSTCGAKLTAYDFHRGAEVCTSCVEIGDDLARQDATFIAYVTLQGQCG